MQENETTGLTKAIEEHEQTKIDPSLDTEPEPESDTVYVVAANYDGDPHPHVEGVFANREDAMELKKKCASVTQPPHPIAWQVFEREVTDSVRESDGGKR